LPPQQALPSCGPCLSRSTRKPSTSTLTQSDEQRVEMSLWWSSIDQVARRQYRLLPALQQQGLPLGRPSPQLHVRTLHAVLCRYVLIIIAGPFELTKQAAQISVLMAKSNTSSMDDPIRQSYQQKGTFKTAKNIVMNRGFSGLYNGFNLHLCK